MRGFHGSHVRDYMVATSPAFAVGEYWDSLAYSNGIPNHNQVAASGCLAWPCAGSTLGAEATASTLSSRNCWPSVACCGLAAPVLLAGRSFWKSCMGEGLRPSTFCMTGSTFAAAGRAQAAHHRLDQCGRRHRHGLRRHNKGHPARRLRGVLTPGSVHIAALPCSHSGAGIAKAFGVITCTPGACSMFDGQCVSHSWRVAACKACSDSRQVLWLLLSTLYSGS